MSSDSPSAAGNDNNGNSKESNGKQPPTESASSGSDAASAPSAGQASAAGQKSTATAAASQKSIATAAASGQKSTATTASANSDTANKPVKSAGPKKISMGPSNDVNPGLFPETRPSEIEEAPSDYAHIFHEPTNAPMPNATGLTGGAVTINQADAVPVAPTGPSKSPTKAPAKPSAAKSPPMKRVFPARKPATPLATKKSSSPRSKSPTKLQLQQTKSPTPVNTPPSAAKASRPSKTPVKLGPKSPQPKIVPSFERVMGKSAKWPCKGGKKSKSPTTNNKALTNSKVSTKAANTTVQSLPKVPTAKVSRASVISAASKVGKDGASAREKELKHALDVATNPTTGTAPSVGGFDQAKYLDIIGSGRVKYVDPWTGEVVYPRAAPSPNRYGK